LVTVKTYPPNPNIALFEGGGGPVTLIPPVNVIPPVKSIIVFLYVIYQKKAQ
jgi:hypothetical protein